MKKIKFSRAIGTLMAVVTLATCLSSNSVYAAEVDEAVETVEQQTETESSITPYGGIETLPLDKWYTISSAFTIDDYNYTPMKTVEGQYLKLKFRAKVNLDLDSKVGDVKVTIKIRDYNTKAFIKDAEYSYTMPMVYLMWQVPVETPYFNLGYAGRKIQIYTKISTPNSSSTAVRVVDFDNYQSYSTNRP